MKYACELCGMVYDEQVGDPKRGIPAGTLFADLPVHYGCMCGLEKEAFSPIARQTRKPAAQSDRAFWLDTKYSDGNQESDR